MIEKIKIATRISQLALWQAKLVDTKLQKLGYQSQIIAIKSEGDKLLNQSLAKIGGKGLFIKQLEIALSNQKADIAVHSMKDMPCNIDQKFTIASFLSRANPKDCLVLAQSLFFQLIDQAIFTDIIDKNYQITKKFLTQLPDNFVIGTSSLRRSSQLLSANPQLKIKAIRGNVNTRLKKLEQKGFDALVLARSGIDRLLNDEQNQDWIDRYIFLDFDYSAMLPAVNQGTIGIECLTDNENIINIMQKINCKQSQIISLTERSFNRKLGGSCISTVAALAQMNNKNIHLTGKILAQDGSEGLELIAKDEINQAENLGIYLADLLLAQGAKKYLI